MFISLMPIFRGAPCLLGEGDFSYYLVNFDLVIEVITMLVFTIIERIVTANYDN